jgi:hypothetical protein
MYHKIMVPLEGSDLAECVLPHVEALTTGSCVPVLMVRAPRLHSRHLIADQRFRFKVQPSR